MRVFGSRCWYVLPGHKVKKLDSRAREARFVGYASSSKGYNLWDEDLGRMVASRNVRFDENVTDVDTDSETDEDVQKVPATEVKSVPVFARPADDTEGPGDTPNNENNDSPVVSSGT